MAENPNPQAQAARELARRGDGTFGIQARTEPTGGLADGSAFDARALDIDTSSESGWFARVAWSEDREGDFSARTDIYRAYAWRDDDPGKDGVFWEVAYRDGEVDEGFGFTMADAKSSVAVAIAQHLHPHTPTVRNTLPTQAGFPEQQGCICGAGRYRVSETEWSEWE